MNFYNKIFSYSKNLIFPFGYMLPSASSFFITIWLSNFYTKSDFGNFGIFRAAIFTLWPFIGLSTHFYLQSHFHRDIQSNFAKRVFSAISVNIFSLIIVEILFIIFLESLVPLIGISSFWILFIPLAAVIQSIIRIVLTIFQLEKNTIRFLIISVSQIFLNIIILVYFVLKSESNWEDQAIAFLVANILTAFIGILFLLKTKHLSFKTNLSFFRDSFIFGLSAIMVDICIVAIGFSDKIFIKKLIGTETLGLYTLAVQLAVVVSVIDSAFTQAIYPRMYAHYANNNAKRANIESLLYLGGLAFLSLVYVLIAPYVLRNFVGTQFLDSLESMKLIVLSLIILSLYKVSVSKLYYFKKMKLLFVPSLGIILLNILFHFLLIPKYGVEGAIVTNIISYLLLTVSVLIISFKTTNSSIT